MGSSHSSLAAPQLPDQFAKRGVPPVIQARLKKSWTRLTINLNEPGAPPSYCATLPDGWWGVLTLHNGPSEADAAIAHAVMKGKSGAASTISLPPPTAGDASLDGKEVLRYRLRWRETYWFAMDVGEGPNRRVEQFEWRRSRGPHVKSVGQGSYGWKLVRLAPEDHHRSDDETDGELAKEGVTKEPDDEDEEGEMTKDGKEIVAVWADASMRKMSMTNVGELRLLGPGATGEFGPRWGLMAVMTSLSIWQKAAATAMAGAAAA